MRNARVPPCHADSTHWLRRGLAAFAAAFVLLGATAAGAAGIVVNSLLDDGINCTLRNAVNSASDGTSHGGCAAGGASNTITFSASGTIVLTAANGPLNIINNSLTITGNGIAQTIIDGNAGTNVFDNFGSAGAMSITLQSLTVRNGFATGFTSAAGMFIDTNTTATVTGCVFSGNNAPSSGGAIENWGALTVTGSTFSANTAAGEGGAIRTIGSLSVSGSTFSANSADIGGAIYHSTGSVAQTLTVLNSTFSGNSATSFGGAIAVNDITSAGAVTLTHVTVAGNTSTGGNGGGVYRNSGAAFTVDRTIIASNTAAAGPDCAVGVAQSLNSLNFNVFGSLTGCSVTGTTTNNVVTATPLLGALANNGGPTQTVALLGGSPAIDIAPTCATGTDQRGVVRPIGAACDAGAFEAPLPIALSPASLPAGQVGAAYSQTITASNGTGPYTFAITLGALPAGLSLSAAGVLSGTPTAGGSFNFTVTATDTFDSRTGARAYALSVAAPAIAIAPATVPGGTFGSAYSQSLSASGGTAPYSYAVTAGALPTGIVLSAAGVISGTSVAVAATYNFTVTATDSSTGTGPFAGSRAYALALSATVPGAPTAVSAAAGSTQATLSFSAPASNGGSVITGYTVTSAPGGFTATGAMSPITVTGLANGTPYTFTVTATNVAGTGAASAASNSVTPATVPGAPAIGSATAGNAQATVTFTAPASNGGSAITGYTVTSAPGGFTATGAVSPITVTGLANGTPYTFTVTATNVAGTGAASAASNSVTPAIVPGAPTIGSATAGNAQATVTFTAPASNGGSAITGYTVTSAPGGFTATGAVSPITVTGLANGTAYTFTVTAANAVGTGAASAASNSVTPAIVPGAPTIGTATPGNGSATISFTPPASNGDSPITSFTATCNPGPFSASAAASPITVSGLTNGTTYTCSVTATNGIGIGPSSGTVSVTPAVPALVAVQSRKVHAAAGAFDLAIDTTQPIGGPVTVEPRAIGTGHQIVFQFNVPVNSIGAASAIDGAGAPAGTVTATMAGSEAIVTLTGVPDNERVTVSLTGVNGSVNASASLGFLVGDVNNSRSVTATDILQVKGRSGQVTDATNFKFDVNASGAITASDIFAVKGQSGLVLP
jgi:predicted outer membrane repeat protein